jgi:hypothetical protein
MRRPPSAALAALLLAGLAAGPSPSRAAARPLDAADRRDAIEQVATTLQDQADRPEAAARQAAMLRARLKAGAYDGLTDATALGETVVADLRAAGHDGDVSDARGARARRRPPHRGS